MEQKKRVWKKVFLMAILISGMVAAVLKNSGMAAASAYTYGDFAVTALSSTSVSIDYRNLYYETVNGGASVLGYQIYLKDYTASTDEILMTTANTNQVYGTIPGLVPGHEYCIKVSLQYQYPGTTPDYMYYDITFTTPASGISSVVDIVSDTPASPAPTQQAGGLQSTSQPTGSPGPSGSTTALMAPSVESVKMAGSTVGVVLNSVVCDGYEYGIYNQTTGNLVQSESSVQNSTTIYGLGRKTVYYVQARAYVYDNSGNKVYSVWGNKKYFIPQPQIKKNASKLKKNSIHLKWAKVAGASKYTIYMRKRGGGKWNKVKTVNGQKASYKITRYKGKKFDTYKNNYEVKIKASVNIGGTTVHSATNDYIYTYTYTRYR